MKLARPGITGQGYPSAEGSNPSPSTPVGGAEDKTATITPPTFEEWIASSHLWVLEGQFVIRGMVVNGRECSDLPWRRKKDNEPASQSEIAREMELVKALYIRGKMQTPKDFELTKLYLREDIK